MNIPTVLRKFFRPQPEPKSPATVALERFLVERKKSEIKADAEPEPAPRHRNRVLNRTFKTAERVKNESS